MDSKFKIFLLETFYQLIPVASSSEDTEASWESGDASVSGDDGVTEK